MVGPLAEQGHSAIVFVQEGQDILSPDLPRFENQKALSEQGMKRVSDDGPSQMTIGKCSLLEVSPR